MKATKAVRRAWQVYTGQFGAAMGFLLVEVVLRLMVLAPLLFLATEDLKWGALLSVPLFVLIVLPARQNAAEVLQDALRGNSLFSARQVFGRDYWRKVARGLKVAALLFLWAAVWIAVTVWAYQIYAGKTVVGQTDFFSVLMAMSSMGGGDLAKGAVYMLLLYLCTALPFVFGLAFHSGRRHEYALGSARVVPGHRGLVVRTWLLGLLTLVPFAVVAAIAGADYLRAFAKALGNMTMGLSLPSLDSKAYLIGGAFVLLMLPLVPLKSLMTAACVHGLWEGKE